MTRRVKENQYGNLIGYEGTKRVHDFGLMTHLADEWLNEKPVAVCVKTRYHIVPTSSNSSTGEWFRIHTANCQDVQREENQFGGNGWDIEAESAEKLRDAELKELQDQDGEDAWQEAQWKILPCAKGVTQ